MRQKKDIYVSDKILQSTLKNFKAKVIYAAIN
jgi:hypothetical protein